MARGRGLWSGASNTESLEKAISRALNEEYIIYRSDDNRELQRRIRYNDLQQKQVQGNSALPMEAASPEIADVLNSLQRIFGKYQDEIFKTMIQAIDNGFAALQQYGGDLDSLVAMIHTQQRMSGDYQQYANAITASINALEILEQLPRGVFNQLSGHKEQAVILTNQQAKQAEKSIKLLNQVVNTGLLNSPAKFLKPLLETFNQEFGQAFAANYLVKFLGEEGLLDGRMLDKAISQNIKGMVQSSLSYPHQVFNVDVTIGDFLSIVSNNATDTINMAISSFDGRFTVPNRSIVKIVNHAKLDNMLSSMDKQTRVGIINDLVRKNSDEARYENARTFIVGSYASKWIDDYKSKRGQGEDIALINGRFYSMDAILRNLLERLEANEYTSSIGAGMSLTLEGINKIDNTWEGSSGQPSFELGDVRTRRARDAINAITIGVTLNKNFLSLT